jgi:glycosyltransferase involved in cell wall biosynthesis
VNSLVSVLLPNLNNRRFLEERIETIFNQTLCDWELVIVDNYSEDGAWEYFQEVARRDSRVKISQAPRQGMYANWNNCIRRATGRYVYIATSDDTMPPECLERLACALEKEPQADLAHCQLRMIDERGKAAPDWWSEFSMFAWSSGELKNKTHLRLAPLDGLLHLAGFTVYTSITQLLMRRSLFDRVGLFETTWGSIGDFNWDMRASLVANTIHVADTWGGWRIHENQATSSTNLDSPDHWRKIDQMIVHAIECSQPHLDHLIRTRLKSDWISKASDARSLSRELRKSSGGLQRRVLLLKHLFKGSWAARQLCAARLLGREFGWPETAPTTIEDWLRQAGASSLLVPLPPTGA